MKSIKQLLRQPLKTAIGVALMTLAAAIVCLCVGQALAAQYTKAVLNERFSTVGIPVVQEKWDGSVDQSSFLVNEELFSWVDQMALERPDVVSGMARHGFLSAYIPELAPLNNTKEKYIVTESSWYDYRRFPDTMSYGCAMLVITLDSVSEPEPVIGTYPVQDLTFEDFDTLEEYEYWLYEDPETEKVTLTQGYTIQINGTVTEVLSLASGYRNPVGRFARLTFTAPTMEQIQALQLQIGEQYIVYGMDYADEHWKLIGDLNEDGYHNYLDLENYDPAKLRMLTEEEKRMNEAWAEAFPDVMGHKKYWFAQYYDQMLNEKQYLQLNSISMTLDIPIPLNLYEAVRDPQTGELLEVRPVTQVTYTDTEGNTVTSSLEAYASRYTIPCIAPLNGSAEAFLGSEEGAPWQAALRYSDISNQAFPVIGVGRMDYLADFSLLRSKIVAGRDFTSEERAAGSRVCIVHEALAEENGLSIGDTITLNLYANDGGLPSGRQEESLLNPTASAYYDTTPFTETAEYTIVGFWRGEALWPNVAFVSEYAFTPNTIFVPRASVQTEMEERDSILFNTLVLQNGKIEEFHEMAMNAGFAGKFKYYDQDYSTVAANFHNYDALAQQMLVIGMVIYGVLLLIYLLLYPGSKRNDMVTMHSLGAGFGRCFFHVMFSSLCIVIPASVLGGWIGSALWDYLVAALQTTAESTVALQIEPGALSLVALVQLLTAGIFTICVAIVVAAPRKMASRR